ncbi:NAD(P)-dependent oxidoreductase [Sulfitobacter sabulilitoris]|uniref:NAD(P)-dependent oxidoreductase n=1 Tax=Sulfitobacter sabulilitoris TaxID=2562655 RepID=A0A5S3QCC3_9RHOB|nr:NAD(P)-dependent oxidoreductase [Sulfitobacter sabulilitoris]TMM54742.1 NAD(P)-dependent oxidoreductase [Sulfitobacter sabulilitoris]
MKVGFAGLGRMGQRMAINLAGAGHDLTVWNRTPGISRVLAEQTGCAVADTPADLAAGVDVVITMLSDDRSSEDVHLGPQGLFAAPAARIFLEMGTMSPDHIADLARAAPEGVAVIDAPVSGATQAAADAKLLILAGCTEPASAPVRPLLDAMGRTTVCLGTTGAGAVMKLVVNAMIHGLNQTLAEAMTLAEAAGIAPDVAFDVIENSAAAAPMLKYRRPLYLDEAAHDVTFTVALARKDMDVTAALAGRLGVAMPQSQVTRSKLTQAEAAGYGSRDMAAILDFMRRETP